MRLLSREKDVLGYLFIHLLKEDFGDLKDSFFAHFADLLVVNQDR